MGKAGETANADGSSRTGAVTIDRPDQSTTWTGSLPTQSHEGIRTASRPNHPIIKQAAIVAGRTSCLCILV